MNSRESLEQYRMDFPALKRQRDGQHPVYLDNACTTLVPEQVIASINEYYTGYPSCGGARSRHWFAEEVTSRIEGNPEQGIKGSRKKIADFINAGSEEEIVFTTNTSYAINMVALGFKFQPEDVVLLTDKEHNSNLVPWLKLQKKGIIKVDHTLPNSEDGFDFDAFEQRLKSSRVRLVSMAYTSNSTGYTIPAADIIRKAHKYGARVLLDGAQTVPHRAVDVQALDVDFLAFSIHKMCGPRGVGVLFGKKELLGQGQRNEDESVEVIEPVIIGGGNVGDTTYDDYSLLPAPARFETGVQDFAGQIAAGRTIEYLQQVGIDRITAHEQSLNSYLTAKLIDRYGDTGWFKIFGPHDAKQRSGILTFEVKRPNAVGIAEELSEKSNIMIRDGVFCVHSYFNGQFGQGWTRPRSHSEHRMVYRVSFYLYNTI